VDRGGGAGLALAALDGRSLIGDALGGGVLCLGTGEATVLLTGADIGGGGCNAVVLKLLERGVGGPFIGVRERGPRGVEGGASCSELEFMRPEVSGYTEPVEGMLELDSGVVLPLEVDEYRIVSASGLFPRRLMLAVNVGACMIAEARDDTSGALNAVTAFGVSFGFSANFSSSRNRKSRPYSSRS